MKVQSSGFSGVQSWVEANENRLLGPVLMQYVGWIFLRLSAVSRGSLDIVANVEMGTLCSTPSSGVCWNSQLRVALCAPSAPMSKVPLSTVPSLNAAVTPLSIGVIVSIALPYCRRQNALKLSLQAGGGLLTRTSNPSLSRFIHALLPRRMAWGAGSARSNSPVMLW